MLILEELDLENLMKMVETYPLLSDLTIRIYRRKLSTKEVNIVASSQSVPAILETDDKIVIRNFNVTTKVFKAFGPVISRLKINYWKSISNECEQVLILANNLCVALKEL